MIEPAIILVRPQMGENIGAAARAMLNFGLTRMRVVGPDENGHRAELEARVKAAGLAGSWEFSGPLEGIAKDQAFHAADLFLLPTYSENFGMAVAEALAAGLPVITTTGAPWRGLEDHRCGWWVEPTVDGFLSGLAEATAAAPEKLAEMGQRGRELIAARYEWGLIARQFLAAYRQVGAQG